jgi:Eco29kI restriction endonuclease
MTGQIVTFNPLDKKNLGASVAEALISAEVVPMKGLSPFSGVGIYAIYYSGSFAAYDQIAKQNADKSNPVLPIYVGKAVPSGARKGAVLADPTKSKALYGRLKEHAESIDAAENLSLEDFVCRHLIVDEIWIPLGEALMIAKFTPLWNGLIDGFGNHDPGSGRYQGLRPRWDVVHPGRSWAMKCKERPETMADVLRDAKTFLSNTALPTSPHFIGRSE